MRLPAEKPDAFADDAAPECGFAAAALCGFAAAAPDCGLADDACLAMGCLPFFDSDSLATAALAPTAGRVLFVPTMGR